MRLHENHALLKLYELSGASLLQHVHASQIADGLGLNSGDIELVARHLVASGIIRYVPTAGGPDCARLTSLGITRAERLLQSRYQELSAVRLNEAATLLANGHWSAAYNLAGSAVACALKARLYRQRQRSAFPPAVDVVRDRDARDLPSLLAMADLAPEFDADPTLAAHWAIVAEWARRNPHTLHSQADAERLHEAVADPVHGVLAWIERT